MKIPFSRTIKKHLFGHEEEPPLWAKQPLSIQLDTTNRPCTLKRCVDGKLKGGCVFCNPQNQFIDDYGAVGDLSIGTIEHVLNEFARRGIFFNVGYPFMESDPLRESIGRMEQITNLLKKFNVSEVMLSTNGVPVIDGRECLEQREILNLPAVDKVSFTICASNPVDYMKVHRGPYFDLAVKTLEWLDKNKHDGLTISLRYIIYSGNTSDLFAWFGRFIQYEKEVWPFHYSIDRKISDSFAKGTPYLMVEKYRADRLRYFKRGRWPCNCFHNLAVSFDGRLMNCCDLPYSQNYGHIEELDLAEVWNKRLDVGLNMEGCRTCSNKNPYWKELFEKYVW